MRWNGSDSATIRAVISNNESGWRMTSERFWLCEWRCVINGHIWPDIVGWLLFGWNKPWQQDIFAFRHLICGFLPTSCDFLFFYFFVYFLHCYTLSLKIFMFVLFYLKKFCFFFSYFCIRYVLIDPFYEKKLQKKIWLSVFTLNDFNWF